MSDQPNPKGNKKTALLLGGLVLGMFGFGFAMVPLYDLFCQVTGIQSVAVRSEVSDTGARVPAKTVQDRLITVKFDGTVNSALPWEFKPLVRKLKVRPGEVHKIAYQARNLAGEAVTGQAIPSVVPWQATAFFQKMDCFCFNRQTLEAGQIQDMPLVFSVSPDLPDNINSLTLSYTFMNTNTQAGGLSPDSSGNNNPQT